MDVCGGMEEGREGQSKGQSDEVASGRDGLLRTMMMMLEDDGDCIALKDRI